MMRGPWLLLFGVFVGCGSTEPLGDADAAAADAAFLDAAVVADAGGYRRIDFAGRRATSAERQACEAAGGMVVTRGDGERPYDLCEQRYPDAGEDCQGSADCVGRCLAGEELPPGTMVSARCEATDQGRGCLTFVEGGVVEGTICAE